MAAMERRGGVSLHARLCAIAADADAVAAAAAALALPVLPNLRCGLWYVPPACDPASAKVASDPTANNTSAVTAAYAAPITAGAPSSPPLPSRATPAPDDVSTGPPVAGGGAAAAVPVPWPVAAPVYFMSKDGHRGQWDVSLRRLNLHLAACALHNGGATVVDSTGRGKALPDSFAKVRSTVHTATP
jgi:hypothetical protein